MELTLIQLSGLVEVLQNNVKVLESSINTLKNEVKTYQQDILDLEKQLSQSLKTQKLFVQNDAEISGRNILLDGQNLDVHETMLNTHDENHRNHETRLNNHDENLNNHEIRLNTLESSITNAINDYNLKVYTLQDNIQNGSIIVQKAEMIKARDENHWLRFNSVDSSTNHDVFKLWRVDNTWHETIRVQAADRLLDERFNTIANNVQMISFDGNKTILKSPVKIEIPLAKGLDIIPLHISVGTFGSDNNLHGSYYVYAKDEGGGNIRTLKP